MLIRDVTRRVSASAAAALLCAAGLCHAEPHTYYISSSQGDDANAGLSADAPWRSLTNVNKDAFLPGDRILFRRGDEWRENLVPPSSGAPDLPIEFATYGTGAKPRFWGSDLLPPSTFTKLGSTGSTYVADAPSTVNSLFLDHQFLRSADLAAPTLPSPAARIDFVKITPGTWYSDSGKLYVNTGGPDPRAPNHTLTAARRENLIYVDGKHDIIVRDLVADESARYNGGYAFSIFDSTRVTLDGDEAYRAGKHHFGVINSTSFVGNRLYSAYSMPDQGYGGATAYVAYSDFNRSGDTSAWLDCVAENLGTTYPAFFTHGQGVGDVLIRNMIARGAGIDIDKTNPTQRISILSGSIDNADLTIYGDNVRVDGMRITGPNSRIALSGNSNVVVNVLMTGARPYPNQAAIFDGGRGNAVLLSTIVLDPNPLYDSMGYLQALHDSGGTFAGNILLSPNTAIGTTIDGPGNARIDYNLYNPGAFFRFGKTTQSLAQWRSAGYDLNSLLDASPFAYAPNDYAPRLGSAAIDHVMLDPAAFGIESDYFGNARINGLFPDIGAIEVQESDYPTLTWSPGGSNNANGSWESAGAWKLNGQSAVWDSTVPAHAVLSAGPGATQFTVTIPGAVAARSLHFTGPATCHVTGGVLVLNGFFTTLQASQSASIDSDIIVDGVQGWDVEAGRTLTVAGTISGAQVHKTGPGTLLVTSAANDHSGFTVRDGVLAISRGEALGTTGGTLVLDGGTLRAAGYLATGQALAIGPAGGAVDTDGNDALFWGPVSASGLLTKTGQGALILAYPSATLPGLHLQAGTVSVSGVAGPHDTSIADGSTLQTAFIRQETLSLGNGASVLLAPAPTSPQSSSRLNTLDLAGSPGAWQSTLDIAGGLLVLQSTEQSRPADLARLFDQISSARAGGQWTGAGIGLSPDGVLGSSATLALLENDRGDGTPLFAAAGDLPLDLNSVLIAYTRLGDLNLDGAVNIDDYFAIDRGYASALGGYGHGDLNYTGGPPDGDDYFLLDTAFLSSPQPASASNPITVPEPATPLGVLLALATLFRRRSSHSSFSATSAPPR